MDGLRKNYIFASILRPLRMYSSCWMSMCITSITGGLLLLCASKLWFLVAYLYLTDAAVFSMPFFLNFWTVLLINPSLRVNIPQTLKDGDVVKAHVERYSPVMAMEIPFSPCAMRHLLQQPLWTTDG